MAKRQKKTKLSERQRDEIPTSEPADAAATDLPLDMRSEDLAQGLGYGADDGPEAVAFSVQASPVGSAASTVTEIPVSVLA